MNVLSTSSCLRAAVGAASLLLLSLGCPRAKGEPSPPTATAGPSDSSPAESEAGADPLLDEALADAATGIDDPQLAALLRDHWRARLEQNPVFATTLGVHGFDDRWAARGPEARAAAQARRADFLARARAIHEDRESLAEEGEVCETWAWNIGTRHNLLSALNHVADIQPVDTPAAGAALLARYRGFPQLVEQEIADRRDGLTRGLVADAEGLRLTVEMLERQLAAPRESWPVLTPLERLAKLDGEAWSSEAREQFARELATVVDEELAPALQRYASFIRDELLPAGRSGAEVGLSGLSLGGPCYAARIHKYTSESPSADALHELGLAEIERIDGEFRRLGKRALGTAKLERVLTKLRTDPKLYFTSEEEVEAFARQSLARAEAEMPKWFGRLPAAPCEVRRVPAYEAPFTTIAYYREPSDSEPGVYFINTHAPTTRPRYEARVLAVHESIPGHHLQIAIAQELPATPAFRRFGGQTVFVEGWALYTERLADEMGLYEDELDRLGVLSFDAWRAARLVVDTGIHARGWTREQAVDFMVAHTALAKNNIVNEVDRYVGWPGQALAYKYGQIEILRLREQAEAALGERFDIAGFHDVVLGAGAVTLPVLRQRVEAWVAGPRTEP